MGHRPATPSRVRRSAADRLLWLRESSSWTLSGVSSGRSEIAQYVLHAEKLLCIIVGDFDLQRFLQVENQLHAIERTGSERDKGRIERDVARVDAKRIRYRIADLLERQNAVRATRFHEFTPTQM